MVNYRIPVTKPLLPPRETLQRYIDKIYESGYIANNGPLHNELKEKLKEFFGTSNLTLTVNGHSGLDIALKALNISGEVITTPFTFVSTTHALVLNNIKPVFCDIKPTDFTIDEAKIEELITPNTTAIMPVHVYGYMCNVEKIEEIAKRHNLKVIYDAAHAFGVKYKGKALADYGDISMISFHATKIFNTIEGGALVYKDDSLARILDAYKNFGIEGPETTEYVGGNAKMNEFQAAMGLANLSIIEEAIKERKELTGLYRQRLKSVKGVILPEPEKMFEEYEYNYSYFPILVDKDYGKTRDELYDYLLEKGIYARKYFYPIVTKLGCYKKEFGGMELPVAEEISKKVLCLPLFNGLSKEEITEICDLMEDFKNEQTKS